MKTASYEVYSLRNGSNNPVYRGTACSTEEALRALANRLRAPSIEAAAEAYETRYLVLPEGVAAGLTTEQLIARFR
jgi:hypothetical protein